MRKDAAKNKPSTYLINRSELARRLGLSARYVNMLFSGERKNEKRLRQIERLIHDELSDVGQYWNAEATSSTNEQRGSKGK